VACDAARRVLVAALAARQERLNSRANLRQQQREKRRELIEEQKAKAARDAHLTVGFGSPPPPPPLPAGHIVGGRAGRPTIEGSHYQEEPGFVLERSHDTSARESRPTNVVYNRHNAGVDARHYASTRKRRGGARREPPVGPSELPFDLTNLSAPPPHLPPPPTIQSLLPSNSSAAQGVGGADGRATGALQMLAASRDATRDPPPSGGEPLSARRGAPPPSHHHHGRASAVAAPLPPPAEGAEASDARSFDELLLPAASGASHMEDLIHAADALKASPMPSWRTRPQKRWTAPKLPVLPPTSYYRGDGVRPTPTGTTPGRAFWDPEPEPPPLAAERLLLPHPPDAVRALADQRSPRVRRSMPPSEL
jgi:hypothetical protein